MRRSFGAAIRRGEPDPRVYKVLLTVLAEAHVATPRASQYLKQLCRHFGHRSTATFTDREGQITFPTGICALQATSEELVLRVTATDEETGQRLLEVIGSHLERFAHRHPVTVEWTYPGVVARQQPPPRRVAS